MQRNAVFLKGIRNNFIFPCLEQVVVSNSEFVIDQIAAGGAMSKASSHPVITSTQEPTVVPPWD
eukprot:1822971-Pyramimonas_sp.AAC.1